MEIPSWPQAGVRELELLKAVLDSPQWGGFHPFVAEFEQAFAGYQHAKHGISAANGTVTLEMALSILGIGAGDEVIVPAISFISTATAISRVGALPVFADIEPFSFNLDPAAVEDAISPRTRAVIPVHFGGVPANVDALCRICSTHSLAMVEDAAHAHGSEWNGRRTGSFGVCGSFSFQNGKVLCSGEGGILTTNSGAFATGARAMVNQGRRAGESYYKHFTLGSNLRLTGFQAAILIAQFESLPMQIGRRTENAVLLKNLLRGLDEIVWQEQLEGVTQNSFYLLPGRLRGARIGRDQFCARLNERGIPCTPFYPFPMYRNPVYFDGAECRVTPCPRAESYIDDAFWFPHRVLLAEPQTIEEIAGTVRALLRS